PAQRPLIRLRRRRFQAAERRLIAGADHLLFAAARDRGEALHGASHSPPATILPNGVDIEYWHRTQPVLGDEIAFSGAMHYPPNDDAARLLVTTIMPRVWDVRPDVRLRIIGRDATGALLRAAAGESRVTVTGYVDDVRPHLERAAVYAAPLRFASGIQNKLLEALAMELPTVTSALGAAGLRRDGVEPPLVVADDPDAVARAILASLERVS